jgi:hypothetical protein
MKPSHLRTPRTLAECYFEQGYGTIEPAQWRGRWNYQPDATKKEINWRLIGSALLGAALIIAPVIDYLT